MKKWEIFYKHTFGVDTFQGTYEEAKAFAIKILKEEDFKGVSFPITINKCGIKEIIYRVEDLIEEILEEEED